MQTESDTNKESSMTLPEILRLMRLNWWCRSHETEERSTLRSKVRKIAVDGLKNQQSILVKTLVWVSNALLNVLCLALTVFTVVTSLTPPFIQTSFAVLTLWILSVVIFIPRVSRRLVGFMHGWGAVLAKSGSIIILVIAVTIAHDIKSQKEQMAIDKRKSDLNAMTPEQKYAYALEQKSIEEKAAWKKRKEEEIESNNAREALEKERAVQVLVDASEALKQFNSDIELENKNQRKFYSNLGAPKLLYQCSGSPLEFAVGAKSGSINSLISGAQERCGSAGYEILKRDD